MRVPTQTVAQALLPHHIGEYRVVREIGRGSMGVVYEAVQQSLERRVALKVLPTQGRTPDAIERFKRESAAIARFDHPGIIKIYGVGEEEGYHYYAMQLVEGRSLRDQIYADRISHDRAARIGKKIAEALEYAHQRGIIHRDLKPANVLMPTGTDEPIITDFGLARTLGASKLTQVGVLLGTPTHMSPEQAVGGAATVDHRADIYSLGAILYEMLTFRLPFYGQNLEELLHKVVGEEPVPPRRIAKSIPRALETITLTCLAKSRDQRYQSAKELADDLERHLAGKSIGARRPPLLERLKPVLRANGRRIAAGFALLAVAGAVVLALSLRAESQRRTAARLAREMQEALGRDALDVALARAASVLEVDPAHPEAVRVRAAVEARREALEERRQRARKREAAAVHVASAEEARARAEAAAASLALAVGGSDLERPGEAELRERAERWRLIEKERERALAEYGMALGLDPESEAARTGKAAIYLARAAEAERRGQLDLADLYLALVRDNNVSGRFDRELRREGTIAIEVVVDPGGAARVPAPAETFAIAVESLEPPPLDALAEGRTAPPRAPVLPIARGRLEASPLPVGRYVVRITGPESHPPVLVPVVIQRAREARLRVPAVAGAEMPPGFAYIAPGPALQGGDAMAVRSLPRGTADVPGFFIASKETTCGEYAAFLSAIPADEARALVPKWRGRGVFWREGPEAPYRLPPEWPPERPVTGVTHEAAVRYARWKAETEGRPYRLPTESEWEKAARAAGAYLFPWGDDFDPKGTPRLANVGFAGAGEQELRPATVGSRPMDRSLHGVLDLMGNAAEWTASRYAADSRYVVVRGGAWLEYPDPPRAASRYPTDPAEANDHVGFRLACDAVPR